MMTIRNLTGMVALAGSVWALGCGSDDPGSPPRIDSIEVRNGTWTIRETSSFGGADSCTARGEATIDTTDILCSRTFIEADDDFPVSCSITQVGDSVTFACRLTIDLGICEGSVRFEGGGSLTDTTFDLSFDVIQQVSPYEPENAEACELIYGTAFDDCVLTVRSVGTWVDPGPTCTILGADATPPGTQTIYTASVSGPAEPEYRWSITGAGVINKTNAAGDSAFVTAGIAGSFTLTLDVGRRDCPYTCQKTVTVGTTALASGNARAGGHAASPGGPAPAAVRAPARDESPFRGLLATVLRRSVGVGP